MTIEEAIIDIRESIKPIVGGISLDMAIEALERRIPKHYKTDLLDALICPSCGEYVEYPSDNCCRHCGQAIDWSDEDD